MADGVFEMDEPDLRNKLEHLRYLHATAERYKDTVFMRAYVLLTASTVGVALLSLLVAFLKDSHSPWRQVLMGSAVLTLAIQFVAASSALHAITPWRPGATASLVRRHQRGQDLGIRAADEPRFSSFNRVSEIDKAHFLAALAGAGEAELYTDLAVTYYNLCRVVTTRYSALRRAYLYQQVSLVLFGVTAALVVLLT